MQNEGKHTEQATLIEQCMKGYVKISIYSCEAQLTADVFWSGFYTLT